VPGSNINLGYKVKSNPQLFPATCLVNKIQNGVVHDVGFATSRRPRMPQYCGDIGSCPVKIFGSSVEPMKLPGKQAGLVQIRPAAQKACFRDFHVRFGKSHNLVGL